MTPAIQQQETAIIDQRAPVSRTPIVDVVEQQQPEQQPEQQSDEKIDPVIDITVPALPNQSNGGGDENDTTVLTDDEIGDDF